MHQIFKKVTAQYKTFVDFRISAQQVIFSIFKSAAV